MGYIFITISIFSFGISNCLWVFPLKHLSVWQVIVYRSFLSTLFIAILLLMINLMNLKQLNDVITSNRFDITDYLQSFAFCAYSYFGLVFYNFSLKNNTAVSIAVPVASICSIFGIIVSVLLYNDNFGFYERIAALFFFGAVLIIESKKGINLKFSRGTFFALMAAFIWGTSFAFFPIFIKKLGSGMFALVLESTVCICSLLIIFFGKNVSTKLSEPIKYFKQIWPISICGFLGTLFYSLSTQYLKMSVIFMLDTITPMVSIVGGIFLLKEKLLFKQYIAVALIIFGLLIMKWV